MWGKPIPGGKKDVDDYALAVVRFAEGQTLQVNVSWALNVDFMQPEMGVRLMGEKGGVALQGMDNPFFYGEEAGHLIDTKLYFAAADAGLEEMKHFRRVRGRQPPADGDGRAGTDGAIHPRCDLPVGRGAARGAVGLERLDVRAAQEPGRGDGAATRSINGRWPRGSTGLPGLPVRIRQEEARSFASTGCRISGFSPSSRPSAPITTYRGNGG